MREFVPTALQTELGEYAHLVRVLRTSRTLDLTAHLLHAARQHATHEADTWTTWPVIDCPVPEWSLDDEIRALGDVVVRAELKGSDSDSDSDSNSDEGLAPAADRLVLHAGSLLVHVLNLLADQRPSVPGSMQNRLWAMNWEDVVVLLGVSGAVHPTVVARVQQRLERIYGPSTANAAQRRRLATSAKAKVSSMSAIQEAQLFACPDLSRTPQSHVTDGRRECKIESRAPVGDAGTDADA